MLSWRICAGTSMPCSIMLVDAEQVRQRLLLDAADRLVCSGLLVVGRLHVLLADVLDGAGEEAAGAAGGSSTFSPSCGSTMSTMNWVTARGV